MWLSEVVLTPGAALFSFTDHDCERRATQAAHACRLIDAGSGQDSTPQAIDGVAFARLYGEPLFKFRKALHSARCAASVSGKLRRSTRSFALSHSQAEVRHHADSDGDRYGTVHELCGVDPRKHLELAADYLAMAAHLMQIKSQLLLP